MTVADAGFLPLFPTRREVADFCNAGIDRSKPITPRVVKWWEEKGFIQPHPAFRQPVRYVAKEVVDFVDGRLPELKNDDGRFGK